MFGSFPPSDTLFSIATRASTIASDKRATTNARVTLTELARQSRVLVDARKQGGVDGAISAGADLIAKSDVDYFGADVLRDHVIPIMVPNAGPKEIAEGKGFGVPGLNVDHAFITRIETSVFRRRLQNGGLALEHFDLSVRADQDRAIEPLTNLLPPGAPPGGIVWIWVNGGLDPNRELRGNDPLRYFPEFASRIAALPIEHDRVRFASKPTVELANAPTAHADLDAALDTYTKAGLPLSLNVSAEGLKSILGT